MAIQVSEHSLGTLFAPATPYAVSNWLVRRCDTRSWMAVPKCVAARPSNVVRLLLPFRFLGWKALDYPLIHDA